jgi:hypothetical protein
MDFHLAIPSYRRAEMIGKKTLKFLKESGAPNPTIYVADQEDLTAYRNLYPEIDIRLAVKGIAACRNFIQNEQPLGKRIVFIDDDIDEIYRLDLTQQPYKKKRVRDFNALIQEGFNSATRAGTSMWGVHPTDNGLTMKPVIRRNLCYIVACFFGIVNSRVDVKHDLAEDFERSLKYWVKENSLCRLEFVGVQTKYYTNPGGNQETRDELKNTETKRLLSEEYPSLCKTLTRKGRTEISFKRFPANFISCSLLESKN